jgi:serine/threonine-protein kinase
MVRNHWITGLLGKTFETKYDLEKLIGEGGAGVVFRACDRSSQQVYAIKILYPNDELPQGQRIKQYQYFQRECGTLARVKHPGIVAIHEVGLTKHGLLYLVMELAEGEQLKQLLRKDGQFSLLQVAQIFSQLCPAVAAMHKQAIIHRDLKPDNIIVRQNYGNFESIKLLDFGMAKLLRGGSEEEWLRTITTTGKVYGTVNYMSPEQCEAKKVDERTDIYSLGIIAYELLAGEPPFRADSPLEVMMAHLGHLPPPLRAARPDISEEGEAAILKALEKDAHKRYENVLEFSQRLAQIAANSARLLT